MTSDGLAKVSYLFGAPEVADSIRPSEDPRSANGWYEETSEEPEFPTGDRALDYQEPASSGDEVIHPVVPDRAWIRTEPRSERTTPRTSGPVFTEEPAPTVAPRTDLSSLPNFIENPVREKPAREKPAREEAQAAKAEAKTERRASNVSLNALARRGMSSREMEKLLERRELEPEDIESEISRLEGVGLLDDKALAENLVRTLQDRKGLGKSAIMAELRRRQVGDEAISSALEGFDADDELERAIEVATKRAGQLASYDHETAKRRLSAYLQRRGYGGSVLSAAMKAAFEPGGGRGSGPSFR